MKIPFDIKDISIYRSELMGYAIVWIMMLHFTFTQIKPLGFIAQYGFAGVEIFLLVSGLGIFFSLDKDENIRLFYRKRVYRIFPTYFFLGFFASIILFHDNILYFLFRYSTIGFWIGGPYWEWYIPSIIALYIIAPYLKKLIDKGLMVMIACFAVLILVVSYIVVSEEIVSAKDPHFFFLYRIPAYMLGILCAYWIKQNFSAKGFFIILLIGIPFFVLLYPHHHEIYNFKYFSLVFLLPTFTLCFVILSKFTKFLNPIFSTIGKASLEIYLIQTIFFHAITTGQLFISQTWHDTISLLLIVVSSLLGIITHWFIDRIGVLRLL